MDVLKEWFVDRLKIKIYEDRAIMGKQAGIEVTGRIKELLSKQDHVNMIFAAAPSQDELLAALIADETIEWFRINAFHMDEYIILDKEAPQRFGNFLNEKIFSKVRFKSVNYIDGSSASPDRECERYTELLKKYPPHIVCMGIGENGHIAFNDPHMACFKDNQMIKIVDLDERCRQQQVNDGCFDSIEKVPTHALTLTIPTLLKAKYIYCIVPAQSKAEAVYKTLNNPVNEDCPSSILRTKDDAILYTDKKSASLLLT